MTLLDLLFPPRCVVCDGVLRPDERGLCASCQNSVHLIRAPYCMKCGKELRFEKDVFCRDCERRDHVFDSGRSLFLYNDAMKKSIYRFKYDGRKEYAAYYGEKMAQCLGDWIRSVAPDAIIPVPLHAKRLKKRGFNQAELIAAVLSKHIRIPVNNRLLIRSAETEKQKELNASERENNLKKAFKTTQNDVELDTVLLMDDIYTTGATADAAAGCLRSAGVRHVHVLTLCIGRNT
ncbi:MAG: ComF family protein [Lachnospiraceae bacterium]|nr:ComF family protein [Lachnospiraceae bacterium]